MKPEFSDVVVPTRNTRGRLVANAASPPNWHDSWMKHIPWLGRAILCGMNAARYETTLEQNAELIANDLESRESQWIGTTVGIIDASK